jgi:hypothetical protein
MQVEDIAYQEHRVFSALERYAHFYEQLSMSVFSFHTRGTMAICSIDTYVYSSMQGTLESISMVLKAGRINDAYALLRKFHDSVVINTYTALYLRNNFSLENFVVEKINHWLRGRETLPEYRVLSQYIRSSDSLRAINDVLYTDDRYKSIRNRCNDHAHYNFYRHVMLNDSQIYQPERRTWLDSLSEDIYDVIILHLGYVFFMNDHYMMSSDCMDALECGMQPEDGSQYWVAPFIQEFFDDVITPRRPDVTAIIRSQSQMELA